MSAYSKLSRPPIIEALVDIQVQPIKGLTASGLREKLPPTLSAKFPVIEEIKKFESNISLNASGPQVSSKDLGAYGLLLRNEENTKAVQIRIDGFALSHLQPYDSFDKLKAEARSLWDEYVKIVETDFKVLRVALRYINVIECNKSLSSWTELDGFLKNIPPLPKGAAHELAAFGMESVTKDPKKSITTTIRKGLLKNLQTLQNGINIDIEVVREFQVTPDEKLLWAAIEDLRKIKNDVFFDVVSAKKIEEYK